MEIYFDNAATTPLSPRAGKAYIETASSFPGNPSSVHRLGQKAKEEMERRRSHMAALLGVEERNLIFTSGATESIALFFSSLLWMEKGTIVVSRNGFTTIVPSGFLTASSLSAFLSFE